MAKKVAEFIFAVVLSTWTIIGSYETVWAQTSSQPSSSELMPVDRALKQQEAERGRNKFDEWAKRKLLNLSCEVPHECLPFIDRLESGILLYIAVQDVSHLGIKIFLSDRFNVYRGRIWINMNATNEEIIHYLKIPKK